MPKLIQDPLEVTLIRVEREVCNMEASPCFFGPARLISVEQLLSLLAGYGRITVVVGPDQPRIAHRPVSPRLTACAAQMRLETARDLERLLRR